MFSALRSQLVSYRKKSVSAAFFFFFLFKFSSSTLCPTVFSRSRLCFRHDDDDEVDSLCGLRARVPILIHALHTAHIFSCKICEKYVFICCSKKRTSWATEKLENYRLRSPNRLIAAVLSSYTHNQMTNDKT